MAGLLSRPIRPSKTLLWQQALSRPHKLLLDLSLTWSRMNSNPSARGRSEDCFCERNERCVSFIVVVFSTTFEYLSTIFFISAILNEGQQLIVHMQFNSNTLVVCLTATKNPAQVKAMVDQPPFGEQSRLLPEPISKRAKQRLRGGWTRLESARQEQEVTITISSHYIT